MAGHSQNPCLRHERICHDVEDVKIINVHAVGKRREALRSYLIGSDGFPDILDNLYSFYFYTYTDTYTYISIS